MKHSTLLAGLALGTGLVIGTGLLVNAADFRPGQNQVQTLSQNWLSIPQIYDRLVAAGYRNIEKITRDDGLYKVRATSANGKRVKLYLHPSSGELLNKGQAHDLKHMAKSGDPNCNKRRCRDDLPQADQAQPSPAVGTQGTQNEH